MPSAASPPQAAWLVENGPRELELLFRAIVYAEPGRPHTRSIAREIRKLKVRVKELEQAAKAWERASE